MSGEESGVVSGVGVFMKSLKTGPCDLPDQVSQELLTRDVEEASESESSLRINGKLHVSESVRDCFLGDDVSQDDVEDEESIDSREVLVGLRLEGRLGNAT